METIQRLHKNRQSVQAAETQFRVNKESWYEYELKTSSYNAIQLLNDAGFYFCVLPANLIDQIDSSISGQCPLKEEEILINEQLSNVCSIQLTTFGLMVQDGKIFLQIGAKDNFLPNPPCGRRRFFESVVPVNTKWRI